jgi:ferredoxin-nitrite reductase
VFRFKFHGLFWVAPAQEAFMVRVRIPGNVLSSTQMRALACLADDLGGGYGDVTTRGNIQIREIEPRSVVELLTRLADVGLSARGSGADNVRNITASPLAGIDAAELLDTRPYAKARRWSSRTAATSRPAAQVQRELRRRGRVGVVCDTNDIGFVATRVGEGRTSVSACCSPASPATALREGLRIVVAPDECVAVAAAMLRSSASTATTDRKKSRLCYALDRLGEAAFSSSCRRSSRSRCASSRSAVAAPPADKHGHVGVHAQKSARLSSIGIAIPVGRMSAAQMHSLARIADEFGSGELRVTVWQNVIVPDVPAARVDEAAAAVEAAGFATSASRVAGCVVACTGNRGCRYAASDTKGQAIELARHLDERIVLDSPINIHLTGCPHSCAQHYVADIGLLGAQVLGQTDRWRATTSTSTAASNRSRASDAEARQERCRSRACPDWSSGCCPPMPSVARRASRSSPSPAGTGFPRCARWLAGSRMSARDLEPAAALRRAPGRRAVQRRAARMAQRLPRGPLARGRARAAGDRHADGHSRIVFASQTAPRRAS